MDLSKPHENPNGSSARRRSIPANSNPQQLPPTRQTPPQRHSPPRPTRTNVLAANGHGMSEEEKDRRRTVVDPDQNFEQLIFKATKANSRLLLSSPPKEAVPKIKLPPLRPQHVYAPMPALGAFSLGALGKKSNEPEVDFSKLMNGKNDLYVQTSTFLSNDHLKI